MKNKKVVAKNALKEIREMFQASGITEAELQASGREIRRELIKQLYFNPEQRTPSSTLLHIRFALYCRPQGTRMISLILINPFTFQTYFD
ncbi:MAG: hypothetical protein ACLPVI_08810 [Dehalococcoidales bacterium]